MRNQGIAPARRKHDLQAGTRPLGVAVSRPPERLAAVASTSCSDGLVVDRRGSRTFVLKTLQIKTICLTPACTIPVGRTLLTGCRNVPPAGTFPKSFQNVAAGRWPGTFPRYRAEAGDIHGYEQNEGSMQICASRRWSR